MAGSGKQPLEINDFSGGITDAQFAGQFNVAYQMDNFNVTQDKQIQSRLGSVLDDAVNSPLPTGNSRIGKLVNYARNDRLFAQSAKDFYYRSNVTSGPWAKLLGPSGNSTLGSGTFGNYVSTAEWNKQMFVVSDAMCPPAKIYRDGSGNYQTRNVGLPLLASLPTVTPTAGGGSYIYYFIYTYTYTVFTKTFEDFGPTSYVVCGSAAAPDSSAIQISNIPAIANTASTNYDTSNIKVEIYRTINNGTNAYRVGSIMNGVTTFTDNVSDTTLQSGVGLYTNDGTLDYFPAPAAKFNHVVGNIGFYAWTQDALGTYPYRVHQSVPGNPGFVPQITWEEVEDEVSGINSVKGVPILLCKKIIYRLEGTYASSGQGSINPVQIHHSAGCISHASLIEAENYLFWAGNDGFYATDGYQVTKISDHLNTRYQAMLSATQNPSRIQGRYDAANRRVIWSVEQSASTLENDSLFCLDLRWGISPTSTFTTWSGKSFRPTAIEIFNSSIYRADQNGYVFVHQTGLLTDPRVDTTTAASSWALETIMWNLTSVQYNFGGAFMRKYVSRILLQAENAGNTTIQITAINDQGRATRLLKPIRWRRNITWGDQAVAWGNSDCIWAADGLIEQWRRFPAGGLRLSYLQLVISNGFGIVANSDSSGLAQINQATKTAYLPGLWPQASVDYFLTTSADNYVKQFQVQLINGSLDTITLVDPNHQLPATGSYQWELFGYEKSEPLNLLGYVLHWDSNDVSQGTYQVGDDGAN